MCTPCTIFESCFREGRHTFVKSLNCEQKWCSPTETKQSKTNEKRIKSFRTWLFNPQGILEFHNKSASLNFLNGLLRGLMFGGGCYYWRKNLELKNWQIGLRLEGTFCRLFFLSFHMVFLFFENIFIQNEIPGPTKWKLAAQLKKTSNSPLIH